LCQSAARFDIVDGQTDYMYSPFGAVCLTRESDRGLPTIVRHLRPHTTEKGCR